MLSVNEKVAILGRPNVGKSTLFNALTRSRQSMVRNEPGVTRDILVESVDWWGKQFDVVDTGGLTEGKKGFSSEIREHVLSLVNTFDLLILVMDGRAGLIPEDRDIVRIAKESGCPFIIAVNKIDQMHEADAILCDFFELGEDLIPTSFEKKENIDQLVEWVLSHLKKDEHKIRSGTRISLVGQPNVGKSSLCNKLLGKKRMLVSSQSGTTIDPVESVFSFRDKEYILVDTAGLRRSSKRSEGLERISAHFSKEAIHKSDIVLLLVDTLQGPTVQDAKIVEYIIEKNKAVIMVANKSDIARQNRSAHRQWFRAQVQKRFHFFPDIPVVFTCAISGAGVEGLFDKVEDLCNKLQTRISTSQLNKFFYEVIRQAPAPTHRGKNIKFYYLTQTKQTPPSFIAFANHPESIRDSYRRFLSKKIQAQWGLKGIPIRLFVMKSGGSS